MGGGSAHGEGFPINLRSRGHKQSSASAESGCQQACEAKDVVAGVDELGNFCNVKEKQLMLSPFPQQTAIHRAWTELQSDACCVAQKEARPSQCRESRAAVHPPGDVGFI